MPTAASRVLTRLLIATFLLLFGSNEIGRASSSAQKHQRSQPTIAAASQSALLAATPVPTHVDTAAPPLLASAATLHDDRAQCAPAPTRESLSLRSYERTTTEAARPPPFQA